MGITAKSWNAFRERCEQGVRCTRGAEGERDTYGEGEGRGKERGRAERAQNLQRSRMISIFTQERDSECKKDNVWHTRSMIQLTTRSQT